MPRKPRKNIFPFSPKNFLLRPALFLVLVTLAFTQILSPRAFAEETRIAFLDFKVHGKSLDKELGIAASEVVQDVVVHTSRISVVERNRFNALAKEHKLQYSGLANDDTAIAIGKIAGASYLVLGSVNAMGSTLFLTARLVSVEKSLVLHSFRMTSRKGIDGLYTTLEQLGHTIASVLSQKKIASLKKPAPSSRQASPRPSPSAAPRPAKPLVSVAPEKSFSLGLQAFEKGNFSLAVKHWKDAARKEHLEAMARLGECCYQGKGTRKDPNQAFLLLKKAAKKGSLRAQAFLHGIDPVKFASYKKAYLAGTSKKPSSPPQKTAPAPSAPRAVTPAPFILVPTSPPKPTNPPARPKPSPPQTTPSAPSSPEEMYARGKSFHNGTGSTQKDLAQAIHWYTQAANLGNPEARNALGELYEKGEGLPRNNAKAFALYSKAANGGNVDAAYHLAVMYDKGKGTSKNEENALKWYLRAAKDGSAPAQYYMGLHCIKECNSFREAAPWFRKAAKQGYPDAQFALGECYRIGIGLGTMSMRKYLQKAKIWYEKAALQGHMEAQYLMGLMSEMDDSGVITKEGQIEKRKWLAKAAEQGHTKAQYALAFLYREGCWGTPQDYEKAAFWLEKAARGNMILAQYQLGLMYRDGNGVRQSFKKASFWLKKAAGQGHSLAQRELKTLPR